jgi:hypothetical protein
MFRKSSSLRVKTLKSKSEVNNIIEECFFSFGNVTIYPSGSMMVSSSNSSGFAYEAVIDGYVRERDGGYIIEVTVNSKPSIVAWLIAICFFPLGALIFLLPFNAKDEMSRKIDRILGDIDFKISKE